MSWENTLNENGIDANTDKDEKSLEADGEQGTQIVLSDLRLLPVAKGGERDGGKADHEVDLNHASIDNDKDQNAKHPHGGLNDEGL